MSAGPMVCVIRHLPSLTTHVAADAVRVGVVLVHRTVVAAEHQIEIDRVALEPRVAAYHTRRWTLMPKDLGPSLLHAA